MKNSFRVWLARMAFAALLALVLAASFVGLAMIGFPEWVAALVTLHIAGYALAFWSGVTIVPLHAGRIRGTEEWWVGIGGIWTNGVPAIQSYALLIARAPRWDAAGRRSYYWRREALWSQLVRLAAMRYAEPASEEYLPFSGGKEQ